MQRDTEKRASDTAVPRNSEYEAFGDMLRDIDERHSKKTGRKIKAYERAFRTHRRELLKGRVLNIGDPLVRIPANFSNVVSVDYFYGTDVAPLLAELEEKEKKGESLTSGERHALGLYRKWVRTTAERLSRGARAVKGLFPVLPFPQGSFDRVLSLNAISMHPFVELGGFTDREWELWWGELLRVLKPGGRAYIGPFDTLSEYETGIMKRKLDEMEAQGLLRKTVHEPELERDESWRGPDFVMIEKTAEEQKQSN